MAKVRRRSGMVFQHFNLLAAKTVAANVALPLRIAGLPRATIDARVGELLDLVGLAAHAAKHPGQLSGGQKQRVGIARALAAQPALLLCDEATSALDPETTTSILALLHDINRQLGLTIVLITHEMSVIRSLARHVVILDHGRVVDGGTIADIFANSTSEVTTSLLRGFRPELPAAIAAGIRAHPTPGAEALLRLDLAGDTTLLADLAQAFNVKPRLLHGGVERIGGTTIGTLFLTIDTNGLPPILAFLSARAQTVEHLGYVDPAA